MQHAAALAQRLDVSYIGSATRKHRRHPADQRPDARADPARRRVPQHAGAESVRRPDARRRRAQHRADDPAARADAAVSAVRHDQRAAGADRHARLPGDPDLLGQAPVEGVHSRSATPARATSSASRRSTRGSRSTRKSPTPSAARAAADRRLADAVVRRAQRAGALLCSAAGRSTPPRSSARA